MYIADQPDPLPQQPLPQRSQMRSKDLKRCRTSIDLFEQSLRLSVFRFVHFPLPEKPWGAPNQLTGPF
jgi:hypothetical protein